MTANRKTTIAVGALFLAATATYIVGSGLIAPALKSPDKLVSMNNTQLRIGVFLEFIDAAAVVAIGVLLLPILRQFSEPMAFGYAASRVIESVLIMVSGLGALLLVPLSEQYPQVAGSDPSQFRGVEQLLTDSYSLAFQMAMVALGAGSLALCYVLYAGKFVPRALAVLGFVGYVSLFASAWLTLFGSDMGLTLFAPGALFEIVFPLWLLVKGLDESTLTKRAEQVEGSASAGRMIAVIT